MDVYERMIYNLRTDENILAEARKRYAAGAGVRGLLRPNGSPDGSYYAVQHRRLADGTEARYLFLRWRDGESLKARSLGRLA